MTPEDKVAAIDEKLAAADGLPEVEKRDDGSLKVVEKPKNGSGDGLSAEKLAVEFDDNDKPITDETIGEGEIPLADDDVPLTEDEAKQYVEDVNAPLPDEQEIEKITSTATELRSLHAQALQQQHVITQAWQDVESRKAAGQYSPEQADQMQSELLQQFGNYEQAAQQAAQAMQGVSKRHQEYGERVILRGLPAWSDPKVRQAENTLATDYLVREKKLTRSQLNALSPQDVVKYVKEARAHTRNLRQKTLAKVRKVTMPKAKDGDFYRGAKAEANRNKRASAPVPLKDTTGDFASRFKSMKQSNIARGMNEKQAHKAARDKLIHERA